MSYLTSQHQHQQDTTASSSTDNANQANQITTHQFKVIMLGDVAVGKTSLVTRFVDNEFKSTYHCTVGVEFKVKTMRIDPFTHVDLKIWDTCGEEKYRTITRQYYRDSDGVVLVFDLTNKNSFDKLSGWLHDIKEYGPKDTCVILVGNKSDVRERKLFLFEEGKKFAMQYKMPYIEVSAKNGTNVISMFENITKKMIENAALKRDKEEDNDGNKITLGREGGKGSGTIKIRKDKGGCC
jgi:Ras-related protein Rab-1A